MPFSAFKYKNLTIEFRDPRIEEMVSTLKQIYDSRCLIQFPPWIGEVLPNWQRDCELPPGCITIALDSLLNSKERVFEFCNFLKTVAGHLSKTDSLLEKKFLLLTSYLLDDKLSNSSENKVVYG